jgi:hypothetical protein
VALTLAPSRVASNCEAENIRDSFENFELRRFAESI